MPVKRLFAAAIAICALTAPAAVRAQAVPEIRLRIGAHLYPRPWGLAYVFGYLRRADTVPVAAVAGRPVTLEEAQFPFTQWIPVASGQTNELGYFSFRRPRVLTNTMYRATVQLDQPLASQQVLLHVPFRPALALRVRRDRKGALVVARGTVRPGRPGATAWVQALSQKTGIWRDRVRVRLTGDGAYSRFRSRPFRIRTSTTLRLRIPSDGINESAVSAPRAVRVPGGG